MSLNSVAVGAIRVAVASAVGFAVAQLAKYGFNVNSTVADTVVQGVAVPLYYAGVRALETYYSKAGWLLGVRKVVSYVETHDTPAA